MKLYLPKFLLEEVLIQEDNNLYLYDLNSSGIIVVPDVSLVADNSDDNAYNGIYLYELADNLETVSKANHVPCKNMYRQFLCNRYNSAEILADGLHPNNIGHARLANVYADFAEANI